MLKRIDIALTACESYSIQIGAVCSNFIRRIALMHTLFSSFAKHSVYTHRTSSSKQTPEKREVEKGIGERESNTMGRSSVLRDAMILQISGFVAKGDAALMDQAHFCTQPHMYAHM